MQRCAGAATTYAAAGVSIFPVKTGQKEPACNNGFKDATTDPVKIAAWWSDAGEPLNIGCSPGTIGCAVVDLDKYKADYVEPAELPLTLRTGCRGDHCWYLGTTHDGKEPGCVEIKSAGGYVLLPPSTFEGQKYVVRSAQPIALLPAWAANRPKYELQQAPEGLVENDKNTVLLKEGTGRATRFVAKFGTAGAERRGNRGFALGGLLRGMRNGKDILSADKIVALMKVAGFAAVDRRMIECGQYSNPRGWEEVQGKPDLEINQGDLTQTARKIDTLLARTQSIFARGGRPVKVVMTPDSDMPAAAAMTPNNIVIETHRLVQPTVFSPRAKDYVDTTLPERVAKIYLDMRDEWTLPPLDGITTAPLLTADGGIRIAAGYDRASRLWLHNVPDVAVADHPSKEQAKESLWLLRNTFCTFPFADAEKYYDAERKVDVVDLQQPIGYDESAGLMALQTAVCRAALWLAPGLLVNAPELSGAGVGKGLYVRGICAIAFGGFRPRAFTGGHNAEEMDKRIVAEAIKAAPAMLLDNVNNAVLRSDTLASLLTERPASVRILGETRSVELNSACWVVLTGNGLTTSEDLVRRFLNCELDAGLENPEQRPFRPGFLNDVVNRRPTLLSAALTIWRWGRQNAKYIDRGKPLGSYEDWTEWVRDPLLALGCKDPVDLIEEKKASDPRRQSIADVFDLWWTHHGNTAIKGKDLHLDVVDVLDTHRRGRQYVAARLGQLSGTRAGGFLLTRAEAAGKWEAATYRLETTVERPPRGPDPEEGPKDETLI